MQNIPPSLTDALLRELAGEHVLWAASPQRWTYAARAWKNALFGIPFTAFAVFWTIMAARGTAQGPAPMSWFFPLWGLMFVVIGLSVLLSPLREAWLAGRTYYAITENRALIVQKGFRLKIQSFGPSAVSGFERISGGDRQGSLIFDRIHTGSGRGQRVKEIGFFGLADCIEAEQALNRMIALRKPA